MVKLQMPQGTPLNGEITANTTETVVFWGRQNRTILFFADTKERYVHFVEKT